MENLDAIKILQDRGKFTVMVHQNRYPFLRFYVFGKKDESIKILSDAKEAIGWGSIRKNEKTGINVYEVRDEIGTRHMVPEFFEKYGFTSDLKKEEFDIWKRIAKLLQSKTRFQHKQEIYALINELRTVKLKYMGTEDMLQKQNNHENAK